MDVMLESKNSRKLLKNKVQFYPTTPLQQTIDEVEDKKDDADEKFEFQMKTNMVIPDENAPKTEEILEVTDKQLNAYKLVPWNIKNEFVKRLEMIEVYNGMDKLQRDKIHALFT